MNFICDFVVLNIDLWGRRVRKFYFFRAKYKKVHRFVHEFSSLNIERHEWLLSLVQRIAKCVLWKLSFGISK